MAEVLHPLPTFIQPHRPLRLRLLNWAGALLRQGGLLGGELTEESLWEAAQRQTGLSDWGDERFRVPLRILIKSLNEEANLNFVGQSIIKQYCIRLLVNRLRLQQDFQSYPEILKVPIERPLFILGLPRTGTTFLHNLLSQDPSSRWLHLWELFSPSPPPERQTEKSDPRLKEAEKLVAQYNTLAPQFSTAHSLNPNGPEEDNNLFEHEFVSILFELRANVKTYSKWLETKEMVNSYQYFRQQLQLLAWRWPGDHWVLKAPVHLFYLDALLEVFPDACIVQTHRDPLKVLPSVCSLWAIVRGIYSDRVELTAIGDYELKRWSRGIERAMQIRELSNPKQFYDVHYIDLLRDPISTVRQIYQYFGYQFSPLFEENLKRWLSENPQHKHGVHRYSLSQFGLEADEVNQRFAGYCQKFNILSE